FLLCLLLRSDFLRGDFLRCCAACRAVAGRLLFTSPSPLRSGRQQFLAFLEGQGAGLAILRHPCIFRFVRNVWPIAAVQHLDSLFLKIANDAICISDFFLLDQLERSRQLDRIRIIVAANGHELVPVAYIGTEAPDARQHRQPVRRLAELARQLEQLQRLLLRNVVHFLAGPQAGKLRFLLVVLRPDLHEWPVAAHAHRHRLAALRVHAQVPRLRNLFARNALLLVYHEFRKWLPEPFEQGHEVLLAQRYGIEVVFELRGKIVVHVLREVLRQEAVHDSADVGRDEALAVHLDIFAILQCRNDARIGGRTTDAVLFESLDQARLREPWGRLGEMLFRAQLVERDDVAFVYLRQQSIALFDGGVIASFLVDGDEARLDENGTIGTEAVAVFGIGTGRK